MATDNSAEKQNIVVYNYSSSDENVQRMSSCLFSILLSGGLAVIVGMFLCSDLTHHESERYDTKFYAGVGLIIYGVVVWTVYGLCHLCSGIFSALEGKDVSKKILVGAKQAAKKVIIKKKDQPSLV